MDGWRGLAFAGMSGRLQGAAGLLALAIAGCSGGSACIDGVPCGPVPNYAEPQPAVVQTAQRFAAAAAGHQHACMLTASGAAWCWGSNEYGQLGTTTTQRCVVGAELPCSAQPLPVSGAVRFVALAAGRLQTCGLDAAGAAWCWGHGGDLGDGSPFEQTVGSTTPVAVAGGHRFSAIAASVWGGLTCGRSDDGSLWCWGTGFNYGTLGPAASPVPARWEAAGATAWLRWGLGEAHACGLDALGQAWCLGNNGYGQLGDGSGVSSATPVPVAGTVRFIDIAVGTSHACGLAADGQAWCWGEGAAVGSGGTGIQSTPVAVATAQRFTRLAAGQARSCGLTADGSAWCWGEGYSGVLGDGTTQRRTTPVAVATPALVAIAAGGIVTCGIDTTGAAWCWGDNETGTIGRPVIAH
jgi:alpha-tubulin suppressor-like RCC1 family protein